MSSSENADRAASGALTIVEAARRLQEVGANEIARASATPVWRQVLAQFTSPLVLVLIGAAIVSAVVEAPTDAIVIGIIVGINAIIGFVQEHRAEQAVLALRSITAARAVVVRDGVRRTVAAREVVPGDMLLLEPGDIVAADGRIVECAALAVTEAVLTGESLPVDKDPAPLPDDTPIADRRDSVFMGTTVATGTARVVVGATGMRTELGKIAHLLSQVEATETPLQRRLTALGHVLLVVCLVLVAVVALLGWLRGLSWYDVLMTTVSLAVSAVPEGLPAVVTVTLAIGVRRLSARRVLVRRLSTVETLGCATVICTDKTGTLTTGVMTVRELWAPDERALLHAAAACCDAELDGEGGGVGDPTELAILRAAAERDEHRSAIERDEPRTRVEPFDTDRRRMAVWRGSGRVYVKGAVEAVAPLCRELLDDHARAAEAMARRGLRVLAVAVGTRDHENQLVMVGLIGLADAPRPEAIEAVKRSQQAGVQIVMITGDHALTAGSIARELGIVGPGREEAQVVFARRTAADKTSIVGELRRRGEIVAMTGDGVNDAPSIREADIGIAMGKGATEVTREAADMILTDSDLRGVVTAIREGRIVYDNIRKTVVYLLSGNAAGLVVMLFAAAVGWPLPLLPLHLLWLNIMCEPLPGLALAVDPPDDDVMLRKPRDPASPLLGRDAWLHIAWVAGLQAAVALATFGWALRHGDLAFARTMAFSTLVFGVLLRAFSSRNTDKLLWEVGYARNAILLAVVVISVGLQIALLALPWTRGVFQLAELGSHQVLVALALGFIPVTAVEVGKLVRRAWKNRPETTRAGAQGGTVRGR